jgi:hypothetical protein
MISRRASARDGWSLLRTSEAAHALTWIPGRFSLAMRPRAIPLGLPGAKSREVTRSSSRSALSKSSNAVIGSATANALLRNLRLPGQALGELPCNFGNRQ